MAALPVCQVITYLGDIKSQKKSDPEPWWRLKNLLDCYRSATHYAPDPWIDRYDKTTIFHFAEPFFCLFLSSLFPPSRKLSSSCLLLLQCILLKPEYQKHVNDIKMHFTVFTSSKWVRGKNKIERLHVGGIGRWKAGLHMEQQTTKVNIERLKRYSSTNI